MKALVCTLFLVACTQGSGGPPVSGTPDSGSSPGTVCEVGSVAKIKFTREMSCANDGSVEFCISANDGNLREQIGVVNSKITCAVGGGRAGCNRTPGLLLCTYPTAFPGECQASHGAMTDKAWADMCTLSSFGGISEIVATIAP
jgi:hypothetical protein